MHKNIISKLTDFIPFLPLIIVYLSVVVVFNRDYLIWDEARYLMFAGNMLNGFYSPPPPDINLWNGPGYPLALTIFVALKLPYVFIRILSSILLYLSIVIFFKACRHRFGAEKRKVSLVVSYILGLYYPIYFYLPVIHTEVLSWFLFCVLIYLVARYRRESDLTIYSILLISLVISYLAMVKIIFGHVILATAVFLTILTLFQKFRDRFVLKYLLIFGIAFIFCIPWLAYTYKMSGKWFYWGNSGGMSLYWMSTPHKQELGDWFSEKSFDIPELSKNHKAFFDHIGSLPANQQDDAFKKKAIENIRNNPKKYFLNWVANIGRILFAYPYSYQYMKHRTFLFLVPNMFIVVVMILLLYSTLRNWKDIDFGIKILLFFTLIYLSGSSLLSAYKRMFIVVVPVCFFFIAYVLDRFVKIDLKTPTKPGPKFAT